MGPSQVGKKQTGGLSNYLMQANLHCIKVLNILAGIIFCQYILTCVTGGQNCIRLISKELNDGSLIFFKDKKRQYIIKGIMYEKE